jgi:ABC-type spermidine/putrescine transport system permease subunit II
MGWGYWGGWRTLARAGGILMLLAIYFPLLWLALMSISERPLSGIPFPLSFQHYTELFSDLGWLTPFMASFILAVVIGLLCMITATYIGRVLPTTKSPGRLIALFILPLFVPGMSMGAALFIFARSVLDLDLGFWSIGVGHFLWAFPFALLMIMVLTSRFDHRLIEAGSDLGASQWRIFWDIEFPLLMPGIVGAGLFGFLLSFNEMLRTIFLRGTTETMPVWNWIMAASQQSQVPIIFALATLVLLVTLPLLGGLFWLLFVRLDKS